MSYTTTKLSYPKIDPFITIIVGCPTPLVPILVSPNDISEVLFEGR